MSVQRIQDRLAEVALEVLSVRVRPGDQATFDVQTSMAVHVAEDEDGVELHSAPCLLIYLGLQNSSGQKACTCGQLPLSGGVETTQFSDALGTMWDQLLFQMQAQSMPELAMRASDIIAEAEAD